VNANPSSSELAAALGELCGRLGLTQARLASDLSVSLPTVSRWVNGKTLPDNRALTALRQYVRKLGPAYGDVLERLGEAGTDQTETAAQTSPAHRKRRKKAQTSDATTAAAPANRRLDVKAMESLLWKAACAIRGEKDAPKFKDYLLPLIFIKRLSDVFEDELARLETEFGSRTVAESVVEADKSVVRFCIPAEARWPVVSGRRTFDWPEDERPRTLGEQVTTTVRRITKANESLQGVIDTVDFNETRNGEREISDEALRRVIEILSDPRYRLGLHDVEPDFLGRAYEYLLRKFAEGQGQSAGEFFTPQEVGWLLAHLVEAKPGEEVYDPCCGSGGLLIKCQLGLREREKLVDRPLRLFGQELTGSSFAIARMNMVLHDMEGEIVRGNTMTNPKFLEDSHLRRFDIVVTNPMWNQKSFDADTYENDPLERFSARGGFAPASTADWAWLQHVLASLDEGGRAAVVIDTGAASRGSGNEAENKEKLIRRWFVDQDLVDAVILLPDNLFYNTSAAGMIIVLSAGKPKERRGRIVLVNASAEFAKGRPKNYLTDAGILTIADAVHAGQDRPQMAKVATTAEVAANDYNLSPSRYVVGAATAETRDIQAILDDLAKLDAETRRLDGDLAAIFTKLGYRYGGGQ
jgi:type I restriction enzyme M protein